MEKDKVIIVVKGTLSHLLRSILNRIEDVYNYFCILSEGSAQCSKFLMDLKEDFEGWKALGPKIKDLTIAVQYMSRAP